MAAKPLKLDPESVKALALELGAEVEFEDGRVFNAEQRNVESRPRPKPAAPPPPPAPSIDLKPLLDQLAALSVSQKALADAVSSAQAPQVVVPAPQVTVTPRKVTSWRFDFERNGDGTIRALVASPVLEH